MPGLHLRKKLINKSNKFIFFYPGNIKQKPADIFMKIIFMNIQKIISLLTSVNYLTIIHFHLIKI